MWLGGISGSGKTTISNKIAEEHDILVYHTDDYFNYSDVSELKQPYMWNVQNYGWNSIMKGEPEHDANCLIQHSKEVCEIVISEISKLNETKQILVEGVCLFPQILNKYGINNISFITQTVGMYELLLKNNIAFMENVIQKADNPETKYKAVIKTYTTVLAYIENQIMDYNCPVFQITSDNDRIECLHFVKKCFLKSLDQL